MDSKRIELKIKFFASLKDYCPSEFLALTASAGCEVGGIFLEIENLLLQNGLEKSERDSVRLKKILSESVLASEDRILNLHDKIHQSCELAILPPVCGG